VEATQPRDLTPELAQALRARSAVGGRRYGARGSQPASRVPHCSWGEPSVVASCGLEQRAVSGDAAGRLRSWQPLCSLRGAVSRLDMAGRGVGAAVCCTGAVRVQAE